MDTLTRERDTKPLSVFFTTTRLDADGHYYDRIPPLAFGPVVWETKHSTICPCTKNKNLEA